MTNATQRETLVEMISQWKDGHALTVMEMLKVSFRPLIDRAVERYSSTDVRGDDVRAAAERLVEKAIEAYNTPEVNPVDHVMAYLEALPDEVKLLRLDALEHRKGA